MDWRENYGGLRCLTALYFGPDKGLELLGALTEHLAKGEGEAALDAYTALYRWLRAGEWNGLGDWLRDRLLDAETPYGRLTGKGGAEESLTAAARAECALLTELASLPGFAWKQALTAALPESFTAAVAALPEWSGEVPFDFESLTRAYETDGCGLFARCRAFLWTGGELIPVPDPDRPGPEEMLGYEWQRREVIDNTAALLSGKPVNNALLFGEGGTGKSATVKSLLAVPGFEALRLIEVEKQGLADLPVLIRSLAGRRQKFILFIDDLAFDQDDRTYSTLKTILEGGLEKRPVNVAIYATSNRRNLVRQTFSDREGDEVDAAETVAEKTSLAERFGLRIPYLTLNKAEYLDMVDRMAALYGVGMDREELHKKAVQWEREHHGCTPRTARQFIASL